MLNSRNALIPLVLVVCAGLAAAADDKQAKEPLITVANDKADKIEFKDGAASMPAKATSAEELEKLVPDEATRTRLAKAVDLKTHDLLVFAWRGSGQDKLDAAILESFPEQVRFSVAPGKSDDLQRHVKLYAVRKDVRWSVK